MSSENLKVIFSADSIKFPLTGVGRYSFELGRELAKSRLCSFLYMRGYGLGPSLPDDANNPLSSDKLRWIKGLIKGPNSLKFFSTIDSLFRRVALRNYGDYIFHGSNFYIPPLKGRAVATIHDLSVFRMPEFHPPERVWFMGEQIKLTLRRASALITPSESIRQEVSKYFNWPLDRIFTTPLASGESFFPRHLKQTFPILTTLGLNPGGYTLYVGTIEPRKNLRALVEAYRSLPIEVSRRWPLVIVGHKGWKSDELYSDLKSMQRLGWLQIFGYVPQDILENIISGARLFVYPSLYEGFGLPVLEAMASGVPVVCSNDPALSEVAGAAALFHSPKDADQLKACILRGLEDDQWRDRARANGLLNASKYSWRRCATATLGVYQKLMEY